MKSRLHGHPASWRHYLLYWFGTTALLLSVATLQGVYVYGGLTPHYYLAPLAVASVFGLLLGHLSALRGRLRVAGEHFRAIAELAQEFTYLREVSGRYLYVSPACQALTGYAADAFYADPGLLERLIHADDLRLWREHVQHVNAGGAPESLDLRLVARDGRLVWFNHVCLAVHDAAGRQIGVRSTNLDITARKQAEARIAHMADYDPLTELGNRRLLYREMEALIARSDPQRDRFALLFLDLRRFKNINDSFGHAFGDRLLQQIGGRLCATIPLEAVVARVGGDEFVILLPNESDATAVERIAERVLRAIEEPLVMEGAELFVSGSMGVAFYPLHGRDPDLLLRHADLAMYRGRAAHHRRVSVYNSHFEDESSHFVSLEYSIRKALERDEFVVYYQPKVRLSDGLIIGLEALVRWQHPESGLIPPDEFIPVAEETGQIIELGARVFQRVLDDLEAWRREGVAVPVAINVSPRQFTDQDFCRSVCDRLLAPGCDAGLVELEITEQVFLGDLAGTARRMQQVRETGARLALDDFGTGYSSLNYLRELPINTLKIDRRFVHALAGDRASHAILRAIVGMCRELELDAVVEGVETEAQREMLRGLGCELAQGFLFHHPKSHDEVTRLLRHHQAGVGA